MQDAIMEAMVSVMAWDQIHGYKTGPSKARRLENILGAGSLYNPAFWHRKSPSHGDKASVPRGNPWGTKERLYRF